MRRQRSPARPALAAPPVLRSLGFPGFPGRRVEHQAPPPLQVCVADERVLVERDVVDHPRRTEQARPCVDDLQHSEPGPRRAVVDQHRRRGRAVERKRERHPAARRGPARQHQIRAGADAPATECLAEVFIVMVKAHLRRDVDESEQPEKRVGPARVTSSNPSANLPCSMLLTADQASSMFRRSFRRRWNSLRDHIAVERGDRLSAASVEPFVEGKNLAIPVFPWIEALAGAVRPSGSTAAGKQCNSGQSGKRCAAGAQDRRAHFFPPAGAAGGGAVADRHRPPC